MKYAICIDLGGTNLKVALVDGNYSVLYKKVLSTAFWNRKGVLIDAMVGVVNETIQEARLSRKSIVGLGIGIPGPVDALTGFVHFLPNIPGIKKINLKTLLTSRLRLHVSVDNDAKLMCLAEAAIGAARGLRNVLCVTLGTGVGGALILNNRLYRGANNAAGEFGHLPINEEGPECACGGRACLERYIGNISILKEARVVFPELESLEDLTCYARQGNKKAVKIWERVGTRLGIALAGVINLLNLDAVVIGGGVAGAGPYLFNAVRATIRDRGMSVQKRQVKVLKASLGRNAGIIGAAVLVMKGAQ
jgi:glucokinase